MRHSLFSAATLVALLPAVVSAQHFLDTFDTAHPGWVTDRYEPAAWAPGTPFMGDNRLKITIGPAGDSANRPLGLQGEFYNTHGRQRASLIPPSPFWSVRGSVYIDGSFLDGTSRRRTDLWARTGAIGDETGVVYGVFGARQYDPANRIGGTNLSSNWRVFDPQAGTTDGWVLLPAPVTVGWHDLEIRGAGTQFEYRLNGSLVYTDSTVNPALPNLTTTFVQAFNFSPVGGHSAATDHYSVYWDNVSAVPEPASMAALGLGALLLLRRRRAKA